MADRHDANGAMNRLLTIPISHYCERARWALQRAGVPFVEEQHLQVLHYLSVTRAGGRGTVPVLVTDGGEVIADSRAIVRFADRHAPERLRLAPSSAVDRARADALSDRFERELAVETRRLVYPRVMGLGRTLLRFNDGTAPLHERLAFRAMYPFARLFISKKLDLRDEMLTRAERIVRATFDEVGALLADGRAFLAGDRFSGADLDFASLSAAVLLPSEYGVPLPALDAFPPAARALFDELRAHPAGAFALRLYRTERHRRA
jgi:glutathione S-transferase